MQPTGLADPLVKNLLWIDRSKLTIAIEFDLRYQRSTQICFIQFLQQLSYMSAIVLNLLHSIPMQSWTFITEDVIRIGRATDNNAILYSAVVSRHHAELRWSEAEGWTLLNLSPNGTYIDGFAIKTVAVEDGMTIRLATSGPRIEIKLEQKIPTDR